MQRFSAYKGRLIVTLYDGAIGFLQQAIADLDAGDAEARLRHIKKAQDIIGELSAVLDMEAGGEVAVRLHEFYEMIDRHLNDAAKTRDALILQEVIELLQELNQSWKVISC